MRQPMSQPTDVELAENPVYREMILHSLKLSLHYASEGFFDLKMLYGLKDTDIPTTSNQVDMLKIRYVKALLDTMEWATVRRVLMPRTIFFTLAWMKKHRRLEELAEKPEPYAVSSFLPIPECR